MSMYAFVSNEWKGIINSLQTLNLYTKLYSYPKFIKTESKDEAIAFIMSNSKEYIRYNYIVKEKDNKFGYVDVSYVMDDNYIYVNVDTRKIGNISMEPKVFNPDISYSQGYEKSRFILNSNGLKDWSISNHLSAICYILNSIDKTISLNMICPDISVYLKAREALKDSRSSLSRRFASRRGEVYWTVKGNS